MSFINDDDFKCVIKNSPLFAIDLVCVSNNSVLMGRRSNEPAKSYWFVPGGRVRKNEKISDAVLRISSEELDFKILFSEVFFIGIYDHFYENSVFGNEVDTHYVTAVYVFYADINLADLPSLQHYDYSWFPFEDIERNPSIHVNSKLFINKLITWVK